MREVINRRDTLLLDYTKLQAKQKTKQETTVDGWLAGWRAAACVTLTRLLLVMMFVL